jgi:hypothetical protein
MATTRKQRRPNLSESGNPPTAEPSAAVKEKPEVASEEADSAAVISSNGRSFHIDFVNRQDHYRGRIMLLGTDHKKAFKGVDVAALAEFISEHLPRLPQKSAASSFGDISFRQSGRIVAGSESLSARTPFCIQVRWQLPEAPTLDDLDEHTDMYGVDAWVLDEHEEKIVAHQAEGDTLRPGIASYEIPIQIDGLKPGKYILRFQVISPFGRVRETTKVKFCVEA